jgi:hypothetical protein
MVMTCREIEVTVVKVAEVLEESRKRGSTVPPDLYDIASSKYNVTVEPLRTPVAEVAGTMELAKTVGLFVSATGIDDCQMSFVATVVFAFIPAIKNMVSSCVMMPPT